MQLFFLRHGIAIERGDPGVQNDEERSLTPKGIKRVRQAANGLRVLGVSLDAILTSPVLRARQTAEIVAAKLKLESALQELMDLRPESTVDHLLFGLSRLAAQQNLLIIGHEPLLTQTVARLLTGEKDSGLKLTLKKAGLCQVEIDQLPPTKTGTLHCWLTPKQLRQMGKSH